ncbi:MAG: VOC family protein [Rhodospirillaceae bacterium]|nr:VOC family protein [Rhodospirillaceae bacterium]
MQKAPPPIWTQKLTFKDFKHMQTIIFRLGLIFWMAGITLSGQVLAQTAPDQGAAGGAVSVMSRMTMVVADIEVSKRFYTYALGYEALSDNVITNPIVKTQMGLSPERTVRFAVLRSSHMIAGKKREGAQLGLIQVGNPALPVMKRPAGADLAAGEAMMAMRTTDIKLVYARLKELKARILLEPMVSPDGRETELVVHDPDGVRIHVVQRPDREVADQLVMEQPRQ